MNYKYFLIGLSFLGILDTARAQVGESNFTKTIGLSTGIGTGNLDDLIYNIEVEWSWSKSIRNINLFLNFEYSRYSYCPQNEEKFVICSGTFNHTPVLQYEPYVDIIMGLSFYQREKSFQQSGLVSSVGLSYRIGIPEFRSISVINCWSYKYFFYKQFYLQGGPSLDFRYSRSGLNPLDDTLDLPFFNLIHQFRLGIIL